MTPSAHGWRSPCELLALLFACIRGFIDRPIVAMWASPIKRVCAGCCSVPAFICMLKTCAAERLTRASAPALPLAAVQA